MEQDTSTELTRTCDPARANDAKATSPPPADLGPTPSASELAWLDLREAIGQAWFWLGLGWYDIVQRYRGSMLGPFWLTLTTGIFVVGLGPLYAALFGLDTKTYLPFMSLGIIVWNFITATINECCRAYIDAGSLMKQMKLPRLTPIFHIVWRNVIVLFHCLPVYVGIALYCGISPGLGILWMLPGFAIVCLNLVWIGLLAAMLCVRFRDVLQIVASVLLLGFFVTPVMWNPKLQKVTSWLVDLNPFAAYIELVRAPLLGDSISHALLALAIGSLVLGSAFTWAVFIKYRRQLIYWIG